jgi:hypothetical protein
MKKNLFYSIIFFIAFFTLNAQTTTLFPIQKKQTVKGWGVSLSWWANLVGGMPKEDQDALTSIVVDELKYNVFRFNIGGGENPNCTKGDHMRKDGGKMPGYRDVQRDNEGWDIVNVTNDARQIKVLDKIANYSKTPIFTEMFSTSPPWWMTKSECAAGNVDGSENIKPEFIDDFADYLTATTSKLMSTHPKWNIISIEPFNEPASKWWKKGGQQEGCSFTPSTEAQVLWRLWQRQQFYKIDNIGLTATDCSEVPETLSQLTAMKTNNPNEYNGLKKVNTHSYEGNATQKSALANFVKTNGNKEIWQSETGPLGWELPAGHNWWERHYTIAQRLVEDLNNLETTVWCDWQFLSVDDGWGMVQQTNFDGNNPYKKPVYTRTKGLFCRQNVTNFIKPGYIIFKNNNANLLAAMNKEETEYVLVYVNNSDKSSTQTIDLSSLKNISNFETYRTSGDFINGENLVKKTINSLTEKGKITDNKLNFTSPAYSVTTFKLSNSVLSTNENNINKKNITFYPNPNSGSLTINSHRKIENGKITITSISGQIVYEKSIDSDDDLNISYGNLPVGIYIMSVLENGLELIKEKIVVN